MFGVSAAYIKIMKDYGYTNPDHRKMVRYCVMDVYITQKIFNGKPNLP